MASPRIAIIGAGLGGLVLARVLQERGVAATVYEGEPHPNHRPQGGMLDISTTSGQWAMREANLYEEFTGLFKPLGERMRIATKNGDIVCDSMPEVEGENPEVERGALRQLLLNSLSSNEVVWNSPISSIEAAGELQRVNFKDGREPVTVDLVVGSDGTWSKTRALLTSKRPKYCGITLVETRLNPKKASSAALAMVDTGSLFTLGNHSGIFTHSGPEAYWVAAGFHVPEHWQRTCGIDWSDPEAAKAAVLSHFEGWGEVARSYVGDSDGPFVVRPTYAFTAGLRWRHRRGVTLIGDAAHVMGPFGGWGANLALQDGAALGLAIADNLADWDSAVAEHERAMFKRTLRPALLSKIGMAAFFGPNAAHVTTISFDPQTDSVLARAERLTRVTLGLGYLRAARDLQALRSKLAGQHTVFAEI